jgi:hypothetical protein
MDGQLRPQSRISAVSQKLSHQFGIWDARHGTHVAFFSDCGLAVVTLGLPIAILALADASASVLGTKTGSGGDRGRSGKRAESATACGPDIHPSDISRCATEPVPRPWKRFRIGATLPNPGLHQSDARSARTMRLSDDQRLLAARVGQHHADEQGTVALSTTCARRSARMIITLRATNFVVRRGVGTKLERLINCCYMWITVWARPLDGCP